MKRINNYISVCVLILLLCCNVCVTYAQSADEFCGDWVGTYTERLPINNNGGFRDTQIKMYIRINKMDSKYMVRIKTQSSGSDMTYWPTCEGVSRQGNSLYFTMDRGEDHDWDADDKYMGRRIRSAHYVIHGSVSAGAGSIQYKDYLNTTYYCDGGVLTQRSPINGEYIRNITLYKDDGW